MVERTESRERLMCLRAVLAQVRELFVTQPVSVGGTRDSRIRRGTIVE